MLKLYKIFRIIWEYLQLEIWLYGSRNMMRNRSIFFVQTDDVLFLPFIRIYRWNNFRFCWFSIEHGHGSLFVPYQKGSCEIAAVDWTCQQYKLYWESFVPNLIIFVSSITEIIYSFSRWKLSRILIEFPWHFLIREINQHSLHFI